MQGSSCRRKPALKKIYKHLSVLKIFDIYKQQYIINQIEWHNMKHSYGAANT